METISIILFTLTQSSLFFLMMFLGWIIYLLLDFSAMNKATPSINLTQVVALYWRFNAVEMIASMIMLVVLAMMQSYNQLEQFLAIIGLKFENANDVPLGFALILGINVKAIALISRKIKTPINLSEESIKPVV